MDWSFEDVADEVRIIAQQCAWDTLNRVGDEQKFFAQGLVEATRLIVSWHGYTDAMLHALLDVFHAEYKREIERHSPSDTIDVSDIGHFPKAS